MKQTFAIQYESLDLPPGGGEPVRFVGATLSRCSFSGSPVTALNVAAEPNSFDCAALRLYTERRLQRVAGAITLLVCGQVVEVGTGF